MSFVKCTRNQTLIVHSGAQRTVSARCAGEDGVAPPKRKGSLKAHGYTTVQQKTQRQRRDALKKAIAEYGKPQVKVWLSRLKMFSKNQPDLLKIYTEDIEFVTRSRVRKAAAPAPNQPAPKRAKKSISSQQQPIAARLRNVGGQKRKR